MPTPQRYQSRLIGLALGVILALLLWPATRWLVRSQLALCFPLPATVAPWSISGNQSSPAAIYALQRLHETALRHPNDYLLQFSDALVVPPAGEPLSAAIKVQRLRDLTRRYPERPTLYASILRFATLRHVRIERDEMNWLTGDTEPPHKPDSTEAVNTPEALAAYDRDAAEGERLDPDNAYFPAMRSVGLFAAHRDEEALAMLGRAAQKPNWTEYYADEVEGEQRLAGETFGADSVLPRLTYAYSILFPHYAQLRNVSRVASALAAQDEQQGRIVEGLAIRANVRKLGSLMRVHCSSAIGSLVGIAMTQMSLERPGGAPSLFNARKKPGVQVRELRLHEYTVYCALVGHKEAIADAQAVAAADNQVFDIFKYVNKSPLDEEPARLVVLWNACLILLSNALWMLLLGGAAALLARHRLIRSGRGLPPVLRVTVALGLVSGAALSVVGILQPGYPSSLLVLCGFLLSGLVMLALPGAGRADRLRRLAAFGLSLGGAFLLGSAFFWQAAGSLGTIVQSIPFSGEGPGTAQVNSLPLLVGVAALLPVLTLLTLGALSLFWQVPLSVGMVRGLRGAAVPIACVLLLAYSVLVPVVLRQEIMLQETLKRTVQHEGRYIAELVGKEWPGDTP